MRKNEHQTKTYQESVQVQNATTFSFSANKHSVQLVELYATIDEWQNNLILASSYFQFPVLEIENKI